EQQEAQPWDLVYSEPQALNLQRHVIVEDLRYLLPKFPPCCFGQADVGKCCKSAQAHFCVPRCVKKFMAMPAVGFKMAALSPLVPGVDEHQLIFFIRAEI